MPPLSFSLLAFTFFCFFPLAALMPRAMPAWLILTALAMLPLLPAIAARLREKGAALALLAVLAATAFSAASALWSPSPKAAPMAIDLLYTSFSGLLIFMGLGALKQEQAAWLHITLLLGFIAGLVFLGIEIGGNFPIHRITNNIDGPVPVAENVPKRIAALWAIGVWPIALLLEQRGRKMLAFGILLSLLVAMTSFTNRSALLGLGVATAVFFFARYQTALTRWVLMAGLVIGLVFVVPVSLSLPNKPGPANALLFDSANHRIKIWVLTAEHVMKSPFFGYGIDASRGIKSEVDESGEPYIKTGNYSVALHPHNIFLQLWLDFGLLGTLLWGGLLVLLTDRTRFLPSTAQPYVLAALTCSLIMLNSTYTILQVWWSGGHVAVAAFLLLGAQSLSRSAKTKGTSAGGMG